MEILFAATELAPFVKTSGLADVAAGLPKALRALGHRVTLVLPRLPAYEEKGLNMARRLTPIKVALGGRSIDVTVFDGRLASQVDLALVDAPYLFGPGGFQDENEAAGVRAGVLCRAIVEVVRARAQTSQPFDVLHLNDWPLAMAAAHLATASRDAAELGYTKSVLTVHNGAHQGVFPAGAAATLGLGEGDLGADGADLSGRLNLLKLGVLRANAVTTVSPSYARELQGAETGYGLDAVFRSRVPVGITNGIDTSVWSPATDTALVSRYDPEDTASRARSRGALQREVGLELDAVAPLFAFIGRIVEQKGVDLLVQALPLILRSTEAEVVFCGYGADPRLEGALEAACARSAGRAKLVRDAPEALVHRLLAAADFVLVPSLREPCGLVQLYAQRYGALPVARATGGLIDTIVDCDAALDTGTGFLFEEPTANALVGAAMRAVAAHALGAKFGALVRRVMRLGRSWDGPARRYEGVYRTVTGRR